MDEIERLLPETNFRDTDPFEPIGSVVIRVPGEPVTLALRKITIGRGRLTFIASAESAPDGEMKIPAGTHPVSICGLDGMEAVSLMSPFHKDEIAKGGGGRGGLMTVFLPARVY